MKKIIIGVVCLFTCLFALASCANDTVTPQDQIDAGYTCVVKFDANGGILNEEKIVTIYAKPDSYILAPGSKTVNAVTKGQGPSFSEVPIRNYYKFEGWYLMDGNSELTELFDFSTTKVTTSFTLYAKWTNNYEINIHYGLDNELVFNKSYSNEKIIDKNTLIRTEMKKINDVDDYTFCGFFVDSELTVPLVFGEKLEYDPDSKSLDIYSKYIEGDWKIVSTAGDLLQITKSMQIYITDDLDFEGIEASNFDWISGFQGTIEGNSHTISNINLEVLAIGRQQKQYALWNSLSTASINDLTFKSSSYKLDYADFVDGSFAFLSGELDGTTFNNVVFDDVHVEVSVTDSSNVTFINIVVPNTTDVSGVTINDNCTTKIVVKK